MKPRYDADEDLGAPDLRYKTVYAQKIATTDVGSPLTVDKFVVGTVGSLKIARGQRVTAAASDTVVTGLATVIAVVASLDDDPGDDPMLASASIGDQNGAPAAGSILIKTWKNTGGTDPTPVAASTFSKKVNWVAIGT